MKMKLKEAFHSLPEVKEWSQKEAGRHLITGLTGSEIGRASCRERVSFCV